MMERIGIELEEAVKTITEWVKPIEDTQEVGLAEAAGRVAAKTYVSQIDNPPFDRSPLDGYAFRSQDVAEAAPDAPARLQVIGTLYAGDWYGRPIGKGQAVRIMTGAPIPPEADCVIRQEDVSVIPGEPGAVLIPRPLKRHENYCFRGEDAPKGALLLEKGDAIGYIEQGILASAGISRVEVYRKPRIAFFVAGDELCPPGEALKPGKIYDANYWLLAGRMGELGIGPVIGKMAGDKPEALAEEIRRSIGQVDMVITTGGVSVGAKDIFHQVLPLLGARRLFWRVSMKPGTPAMFAIFEGKPMLHLSGNPFAAAATFELLALPALEKMTRDSRLARKRVQAVLACDFKKSGGRRFLRGRLENGAVSIPAEEKHASGILSSMKGCNCLVELPPSKEPVKAGTQVEVVLL